MKSNQSHGRPVVIFGTGGVAQVIRYILEHGSPYRVVALTADRDRIDEPKMDGLEVVPFDEVTSRFPPSRHGMFVAIGHDRMNATRERKCAEARQLGYELISHVSDRSSLWPSVTIGPNTIVMEDCTIGPDASVGEGCIVWPRCYVGHGATIGDYCYVAANASVSGLSVIGSRSVLGSACVIRDRVSVGDACVVGVGAVLISDLKARSVVAAARPIRLPGTSDQYTEL